MAKQREQLDNDIETSEEYSLPVLHGNEVEVLPQNERLTNMLQTVRDYIAQEDWNCEERPRADGGVTFSLSFRMTNGTQRVIIEVQGDGDRFQIYAYAPILVREEHRVAVAVFSTYANYHMGVAHLEMDMRDGELRMLSSVDVEDSFLSMRMISLMENATIIQMDQCMGSILSIIYGGISPEQAFELFIEEREKKRNGSNTETLESEPLVLH